VSNGIAVLKIGGSVLTGPHAYRRAAEFVAARLRACPGERLVAVVSAEIGVTDSLLATARDIVDDPDPSALDLLWSTGELRSTALLALWLQSLGITAAAINVHQTGLVETADACVPGSSGVKPLRLRALLAEREVVVAPGFLARGAGDTLVSLGRGGSDLTAVLLAAGLGAGRCELLKDVPGYFTGDPRRDPDARPVASLSYARAIDLADDGCELVQRHALEAARALGLPVVVAAIGHDTRTVISDASA
jgi:aspartate kinase